MLTELRRCFFLGRESAGFSPRLGELSAALAWSCGMETPSLLGYWYLPLFSVSLRGPGLPLSVPLIIGMLFLKTISKWGMRGDTTPCNVTAPSDHPQTSLAVIREEGLISTLQIFFKY